MATRCAIWVRLSKDEQDSGNQLEELRARAERRGLQVAAEYVLEGAHASRSARTKVRRAQPEAIRLALSA